MFCVRLQRAPRLDLRSYTALKQKTGVNFTRNLRDAWNETDSSLRGRTATTRAPWVPKRGGTLRNQKETKRQGSSVDVPKDTPCAAPPADGQKTPE